MIQLHEHRSPTDDRPVSGSHLAVVADPPTGAALDLRLYSPRPDVVVVRVSGALDECGADLLGERVGQQLARATHVVVDLAEVPVLPPCGALVLTELDREATRCGVCLHISGVEDATVRDRLRSAHLDPTPCTDVVVALIPARVPRRRRHC
jgi:anti-anti-sigma regulatory factor